jgi:hypothetical protein
VWSGGDEVQRIARGENRIAYALFVRRICVGECGFCIRFCGGDGKLELQT